MCGFTGYIDFTLKNSAETLAELITEMACSLTHRGPDDAGIWVDAAVGVALGFRRLAIVDLSPTGHQPMLSACGRYVIVFNGEIYNFKALRQILLAKNYSFRGHSDTEIILAAITEWGVEATVKQLVGMFAIALWDCKTRQLYLIRDRIGEKPLYYGWSGTTFLFGSELKPLCLHPSWVGEINRDALALYMRHNCIPSPYSIYSGVFKLSPGAILTFSLDKTVPGHSPRPIPYWLARDTIESSTSNLFNGNAQEAVNQLDLLLREVIANQMVADVPLGAFLSGGIDSSTIVALMQAQSSQPVKTFTIGLIEDTYNEAAYAKSIAAHLGTDHTELYITPEETLAVIPRLPMLYDEPFADSSQIPTFLIAQLARRNVTVSLSGDAGDELFGGYHRYFWGKQIWNNVGWMPQNLRYAVSKALITLTPYQWDMAYKFVAPLLPYRLKQRTPGDKMHKFADILAVESPEAMYRRLVSHWMQPEALVQHSVEPSTVLTDRNQWANLSDLTERMMFLDLMTYLPDDILVKLDRAAMGVSLETRIPFLDHRVIEFAWRLPLHMKVRDGQGKWLLRELLYRYVPKHLVERPKQGFAIPIGDWLRGPLRSWAEELLNEHRLKNEAFFNVKMVQLKWQEHLNQSRQWAYHLWDILMFQAWVDQNKSGNSVRTGTKLVSQNITNMVP